MKNDVFIYRIDDQDTHMTILGNEKPIYTVPQDGIYSLTFTFKDIEYKYIRSEYVYNPETGKLEPYESPNPSSGCSHDWKKYEGLMVTYDYCAKCDVKKDA